jgi:antirestriction protein ArdC
MTSVDSDTGPPRPAYIPEEIETMTTKLTPFDRATDRIIAALEAGTAPWRKPWKDGNPDASGGVVPRNANSGRAYNGLNRLMLTIEAFEKGYTSNLWITPKAAMAAGLDIKGTKTTEVTFWKRTERTVKDAAGNEEKRPSLFARAYRLLNLDQVKGDKSAFEGREPAPVVITSTDMADALREGLGLRAIDHGGDRAFYAPSLDAIKMPPLEAFHGGEVAYKATLLHEAGHATGAKHRLDREFGGRFGDERYAFEELVAELTSVFCGEVLGLPVEIEGHASYLDAWLRVLKADSKAILTAASKAQAAATMILEALGAVDVEAADDLAEAA